MLTEKRIDGIGASMHVHARAIIVSVKAYGEHGAVVRALTAEHGLMAGYVRGGRSRALRPVLAPGNLVEAEFRSRSETQLAALSVELIESRAPLTAEPLHAAAIEWVTALAAVTLAEGHPYPRTHAALDAMLTAIGSALRARDWIGALAHYEALILSELGYGNDDDPQLRQTGIRLRENLLTGWRADILAARDRLIVRIDRAMGR
jgi:DNA repair protein RecO (recombination protein O)